MKLDEKHAWEEEENSEMGGEILEKEERIKGSKEIRSRRKEIFKRKGKRSRGLMG